MSSSAPTSSSGLTVPVQNDGPDLTLFLLGHRTFRHEFARLAMAAASTTSSEDVRVAAIEEQIRLMTQSLHTHHSGEDDRIWPALRERDPAASVVLDVLEQEHALIDPLIVAATDRSVPLRRRAGVLDELSTLLNRHLDREEAEAVPLIRRHFSAAECEADGKIHLKEARKELPMFVCTMTDHMAEAEVTGMMSASPKVLALLYKHSWRRRWAKRRVLVYGS